VSPEKLAERWQEVRVSGRFELPELRLALDYARALQQAGQRERAEAVIAVALRGVDLDRNKRRESILKDGWSGPGADRFDQRGFLAQARELVGPRIGEGLPRQGKALRTLAEVRRLQGRPREALALELAYLEQADLPKELRRARRGWLFEFGGRPSHALAEYRMAYRHVVELAGTPRATAAEEDAPETGATPQERLRIALAGFPPPPSGEPLWHAYFARLEGIFKEIDSGSWRAWMEEAVDSLELDPMARSLLCDQLDREEQARVLARQAVEEGFAALRSADPRRSHQAPFDALAPFTTTLPRGEFVIYCRDLGPIDQGGLLRTLWAHSCRARMTDLDPGFRGFRDGQVAVELVYLPDETREVQGSLLLGESRVGQALVYGGSLSRYMDKHHSRWPAADRSAVLRKVATYAAKHEILVHHSGNFLLRGFRQDFRGNIRGDAYAQDGYLESNHPNDILWNLPELLSPRHPFRSR
jgi:hypothetical protein